MSIVLQGSTSGSITLQEPAVAGTTVLSLPATSGTILTTGSTGQSIPKAALPTGSVLQVVSTNYTTNFSTTSTSFVDVSGFSVTITPTSASSRILLLVNTQVDATVGNNVAFINLTRNGTTIGAGITGGSNVPCFGAYTSYASGSPGNGGVISKNFLDSPATTSAITYQIQLSAYRTGGGTAFMNTGYSTNNVNGSATMSTITVMEIAA